MLDFNGVRVYVTNVTINQSQEFHSVEIDMRAFLSDAALFMAPRGQTDLDRLNKLYQTQTQNGLWLTTPPKLLPGPKLLPPRSRLFTRQIILEETPETTEEQEG